MRKKGGAHRIIDVLCFAVFSVFVISGLSSCEETCYDDKLNNSEEGIDCGGPCVPCDTSNGTCFDGIQNQGETGIDCGGPCNECITDTSILSPDFICEGTGGTSYLPLSLGSYWIFSMPNNTWFQLEITEVITQNNGEDYAHMVTTGAFPANDYYRTANGAVYEWNPSAQIEDVFIPANPTPGFNWINSNGDSIVVDAIDASINSQNGCTYDNLLQVTTHTGSGSSSSYYKQGLGLVELSSVSAYLDSAVVY